MPRIPRCHHRRQTNDFNNSYCLDCLIPSNDKSVNDKRYSSFSHPNIEKSDSTDAVLANTVAIPPQKSRSAVNFPSTIVQPALKVILWSHSSRLERSVCFWWYSLRSSR